MTNPGSSTSPGNTLRFNVFVDGMDLGSFTAVDGLTDEYEVLTYQEGGENSFVHQLPGRMKYTNVKVSRPLDVTSKPLAQWFRKLAGGQGSPRHTAHVVAYDDNGQPMGEWNFIGVWPVKYSGPGFSADSGKVAIETFDFAHHGLLG
jgi:phage tail-like protein